MSMDDITDIRQLLTVRLNTLQPPRDILKAPELRELYRRITDVPADQRREFGAAVNALKQELEQLVTQREASAESATLAPIDVTAPFDVNVAPDRRPGLLPTEDGTVHPLMRELERVIDIFTRMGFAAIES